ncbi:transposable element Tc3 transposase [Trichonephila clavipes]|nr:transposable element Tc3 transposase [Trichonephila clavipes]
MTGHMYRDVILEQHVCLFWGAIGAEFLFMDDNARAYRANIVDEYLQSDWPAYSLDLNPIEHVKIYFLPINESRRGSLVAKVTDSWLPCHDFDQSAAEDPSCRGGYER